MITDEDRKREYEHTVKIHMEQEAKNRIFRKMLRAIKDKLDLFGEEALNEVEMGYVEERPGFFYPRREE